MNKVYNTMVSGDGLIHDTVTCGFDPWHLFLNENGEYYGDTDRLVSQWSDNLVTNAIGVAPHA